MKLSCAECQLVVMVYVIFIEAVKINQVRPEVVYERAEGEPIAPGRRHVVDADARVARRHALAPHLQRLHAPLLAHLPVWLKSGTKRLKYRVFSNSRLPAVHSYVGSQCRSCPSCRQRAPEQQQRRSSLRISVTVEGEKLIHGSPSSSCARTRDPDSTEGFCQSGASAAAAPTVEKTGNCRPPNGRLLYSKATGEVRSTSCCLARRGSPVGCLRSRSCDTSE